MTTCDRVACPVVRFFRWVLPAAALLSLAALAASLTAAPQVRADTPPAGTGAFRVVVEDVAGADGLGVFGVSTAEDHPWGAGQDVLSMRNGDDAFSSYITVRSYTSGTDYVQTSAGPASGNPLVALDEIGTLAPVDGGFQATYFVPDSSAGGEALDIRSTVVATTLGARDAVLLTASVSNRNAFPVDIGVRFLLDATVAADGGPELGLPDEVLLEEATVAGPPSSIQVRATGGPSSFYITTSMQADEIRFGHWNRAFESAFDFEPGGADIASEGGLNDSALLYYFGASPASATTLAENETTTVTVALSLSQLAEVCDNGEDDDLDGRIDADDEDCAPAVTPNPTPSPEPPQPTPAPGGSPQASAAVPTTSATLSPGSLPAAGGNGWPAGSWRISLAVVVALGLLAFSAAMLSLGRRRG